MIEVRQTAEFTNWLRSLADPNAYVRVVARIRRLELGNPGDAKSVGSGVVEMRIDYGPGYRVYYTRRGATVMILLCAGDKRTQAKDIKHAIEMARAMAEKS